MKTKKTAFYLSMKHDNVTAKDMREDVYFAVRNYCIKLETECKTLSDEDLRKQIETLYGMTHFALSAMQTAMDNRPELAKDVVGNKSEWPVMQSFSKSDTRSERVRREWGIGARRFNANTQSPLASSPKKKLAGYFSRFAIEAIIRLSHLPLTHSNIDIHKKEIRKIFDEPVTGIYAAMHSIKALRDDEESYNIPNQYDKGKDVLFNRLIQAIKTLIVCQKTKAI
jgi:hypothetical protein